MLHPRSPCGSDTLEHKEALFFSLRVNQPISLGGSLLHPDLVDNRGWDCLCQGGGRLRECDEGISQEASDPAEHPRYHADRAALQGRQTENHDHLHHRRARSGRGGKDDSTEGWCWQFSTVLWGLQGAQPLAVQITASLNGRHMTKFISTMFVVSVQKAPGSLQSYAVSWPCNTNLWLLQIHTRSKSAALCPGAKTCAGG